MLGFAGTVDFPSEITISLSFTAEYVEYAEASQNPVRVETVLKLCDLRDLRGDKNTRVFRQCWVRDSIPEPNRVMKPVYKISSKSPSCASFCVRSEKN